LATTKRIELGVNVDHVATIRQQRDTRYPDPVHAAAMAELAGADQITIHLREDRRHILDRDVAIMRKTVQTRLNLEMGATEEMRSIALETRPDQVTLVPEKREERTTEGGLDVVGQASTLQAYIQPLLQANIRVVTFVDPEADQVKASADIGAHGIELHTGDYCENVCQDELERLVQAAYTGEELRLFVAAGHGLDYVNTEAVCKIAPIVELNIGHSIISRAVLVGLDQAVREMRALMDQARGI